MQDLLASEQNGLSDDEVLERATRIVAGGRSLPHFLREVGRPGPPAAGSPQHGAPPAESTILQSVVALVADVMLDEAVLSPGTPQGHEALRECLLAYVPDEHHETFRRNFERAVVRSGGASPPPPR